MEWIIHFIAIWLVFILLGGFKPSELKVNIWSGLLSVLVHLIIDTDRMALGLYKITNPVISIFGSSFFFTFGAALVSGMLISMLQPAGRLAKVLHVLLFTFIFTVEEYMLTKTGGIVYIKWDLLTGSLPVNFLAIAALSWFSIVVLKRGEQRT